MSASDPGVAGDVGPTAPPAANFVYTGGSLRGNVNIRTVTVREGVTSIDDFAFVGCTRLTTITIPSSVTSIGDGAFSRCTGLTTITIPSSVTSISDYTFSGCTSLTTITIPSSVTSIGNRAFHYCIDLTTISIPSSVTSIYENAFYGCRGLTTITIPSSVTSIDDSSFYGCTSLLAAAETKGFATVEEWGRHRWFCLVVLHRRVSVLACVSVARRQIFDGLGQEEPVSELLESLAHVPDDVLRVIAGFVGEG